jgi:hypothetical protein
MAHPALFDALSDLQTKPDGSFFMSFALGTPTDAGFAVCDANGNVQFARRVVTNTGSQTDSFSDIISTSDGGYLIAGSFSPNNNTNWAAFFLKMDATGATQWYRGWNDARTDFVTGVRELPGGGYIASGYGNSYGLGGTHDGVAYRIDAAGNLLWTKAYGTPTDGGFSDVAIAADGGFLFGAGLVEFQRRELPRRRYRAHRRQWQLALDPAVPTVQQPRLGTDGLGEYRRREFRYRRPKPAEHRRYQSVFAENRRCRADPLEPAIRRPGLETLFDVRALTSGGLLWTGRTTSAGSGGEDFYVLKTDADGRAGLCPETPHTTAVIPLQITQTNGSLQELTPPVLQNLNLAAQPVTVAKTEICAPDCPEDPPCENTWIKTFSSPGVQQGGTNIIQAADGNFYVSGFRNDSSLLMKMAPGGSPIWVRSFKFASGAGEQISQIIEDSEGHIAGCGIFGLGALTGFIFRYNPATDQVDWVRENPVNPQSFCYNIQEKAAGGNFLATWSHHNSPAPGSFDDANLIEINRNTGAIAGTPFAYSYGSSESFLDIKQRAGFWYTAGRYTYGAAFGGMRAGLSCFNSSGNPVWSRMLFFGPGATARNYASDFIFDGASMVTTVYGDFDSDAGLTNSIAVCKTDLAGSILWAKRYTLPLAQATTRGIISVPNGYIVLVTNLVAGQPPSVCLLHIDKNGNLVWAREFRNYRISRGENLLVGAGNYLYFAAQHLGAGDLAVAKIRIDDGRVGGDCPEPLDMIVSATDLPTISVAVNLIRYPSPVTLAPRNAVPRAQNLTTTDVCIEICTPEICNNGLDDDGDNLFDCLDPDCDCHTCDGSEANIWYFGRQAGLNFTNDPPQVLTDGSTNTNEASAVASDPLGRLIFYTDAKTIFQRNHLAMPNGSGLFGHGSSSQTLIVPHPGNPARFYVFTPDSYDNGPLRGLSYSEVDMTLNSGFRRCACRQKKSPVDTRRRTGGTTERRAPLQRRRFLGAQPPQNH